MAAIWPSAVATNLQLLLAINNTKVLLNVNAGIGDTTITVDDASPLSTSGYLTFDDNASSPETISYTGKSGNDLTGVTRGADGTAAGTHAANGTTGIVMRWNAAYHNLLVTEMIAIEQNLSDRFGTGTNIVVPATRTFTLAKTSSQLILGTTNTTTISATAPAVSAVYTIPDVGTTANFVMSAGTQTVAGAKTFSSTVTISATTNQIVLGVTNTVTITSPAPASSAVYTIPDVGTTASFVMTAGSQTVNGTKTFGSAPILSALTASTVPYLDGSKVLTSSAVTPTELGYVSGVTSAIQTQLNNKVTENILDNGGFEIWQRGITFSAPAQDVYLADRWRVVTNEATNVTITKETTTIDSVGLTSMKVVVASAGASKTWYVLQMLENYADFRGKTVSVSCRVFSSVASAVKIQINDGVTSGSSSYHTGGAGWETLTATLTVNASAGLLHIDLGMIGTGDKKNGTYYFDSAMLSLGSSALSFVGTSPQTDFDRCLRFFFRYGGNRVGGDQLDAGLCYATTSFIATLRFPVPMRATPTATVSNATNFLVYKPSGTVAVTSITIDTGTSQTIDVNPAVASGLTAGQAGVLLTNNINAYIDFTADL